MPPVDPSKAYWFPARRYGWGWGPPVTWQGWVVIAIWFAVLAVGLIVLLSRRETLPWSLLYVVLMSVVLTLICYWKGEPPKWRWGDRST
jgi:hypothetical protein